MVRPPDPNGYFADLPSDTDNLPAAGSEYGPDDEGCIFATSGTTDRPKCVVWDHLGLWLCGLGDMEFFEGSLKDYDGEVGVDAARQLEEAYKSRSKMCQVIAVVLLASNAEASEDLKERMDELEGKYCVPFVFGGHELFTRLLAQGFLRSS